MIQKRQRPWRSAYAIVSTSILITIIATSRIGSTKALGFASGVTTVTNLWANFTWQIKQFDNILRFVQDEWIHSDDFTTLKAGLRIRLSVCVQGENKKHKNWLSFRVRIFWDEKTEIDADVSVALITVNGHKDFKHHWRSHKFVTSPEAQAKGKLEYRLIPTSKLHSTQATLMPNNTLTLWGEVTAELDVVKRNANCDFALAWPLPGPTWFNRRFDEYITRKKLADMYLEERKYSRAEWYLYAHRLIIAGSSESIKLILQSKVKEKKPFTENYHLHNPSVVLKNLSTSVVMRALWFAYTGELENVDDDLWDLWYAAIQLDLKGFDELIMQRICNHLNFQNAPKALVMSEKFNSKQLQLRIAQFIASKFEVYVDNEYVHSIVNPDFIKARLEINSS